MNEAAKKIVTREARASAQQMKERATLGADTDRLAAEAWGEVTRLQPEMLDWNAENYFMTVFSNEIESD